jgi:D-alanyl-D-alanine carboxypeptidase (penicillin-binding protein 5/6)
MHYYATKKYRYPGTPAANDTNRNLLLFRDPTVDGLKTGHTERRATAWLPPAQARLPQRGPGRRLLSIVLGTASENARANESQKLLNWGYTAFEAVKLFDANTARGHAAVWKGTVHVLKLGRPRHRGGGARGQRRPRSRQRSRAPTRWWLRSPRARRWAR